MLAPSGEGLILYQAYGNLYALTGLRNPAFVCTAVDMSRKNDYVDRIPSVHPPTLSVGSPVLLPPLLVHPPVFPPSGAAVDRPALHVVIFGGIIYTREDIGEHMINELNRPTEDIFPWPGNANMAFDSRPTEDVLPWPGSANMAFDLRPTEDVLPWPGSANMAFDLRPTEDVLPWPGNANMEFDLRSTKDVLSWPERHGRTADTKKESMSGHAEYRGRTGPMTADTKKENMTGHAKRHERTERHGRTTDTKKENMSGRKHR
nr:hypothetical protein [Tanacetum cinerariifolium]